MRNKGPKKTTIYMATNIANGKRYIGVTTKTCEQRAKEHLRDAFRRVHNGMFYRAIRKYGKEMFRFEVIEIVGHTNHGLRREIELIAELKPEYNSTKGGDGRLGGGFTKDGLRRISEFQKGKSWRLGMSHSRSTRKKLSEIGLQNKDKWAMYSHLGPKAVSRKVICLDTGEIYESASAAAAAHDIAKSMIIELCLHNKRRKTAAGMIFRYVDDYDAKVA